jgi:microcystin-dependent protein
MEKSYKILIIILLFLLLGLGLSNIIRQEDLSIPQEDFSVTASSNQLLACDNSGNFKNVNTNNSSILLTNQDGEFKNLSFPKGLVMMWYNSGKNPTPDDIPLGWALCDGSISDGYQTPDLRGRFILGFNPSNGIPIGSIGGQESVKLDNSQIPPHTHQINMVTISNNRFRDGGAGGADANVLNSYTSVSSDNGTGGGQPHENMPPYYVLSYICYTGNKL